MINNKHTTPLQRLSRRKRRFCFDMEKRERKKSYLRQNLRRRAQEGVSCLETGLHNTSEIGRLKKVLLHRPGRELENLMPEYLALDGLHGDVEAKKRMADMINRHIGEFVK